MISYKLLPFVFWVSLVISVLVRVSLWNIFVPTSVIGKIVRISGKVNSFSEIHTSNGTKYIITFPYFRIESGSSNDKSIENIPEVIGQDIAAVGILDYRLPEKKTPDFVLRNATILLSGIHQSRVQNGILLVEQLASSIHAYFVESLGNYFSQNELSLFIGMLLGTKEELSFSFYQKIQQSGLLHLVAASGYNIMIVLGVSSAFVSLLAPRVLSIPITLFLVVLYVFISGGQASVVRAAFMGCIGYLSIQTLGSTAATKRLFSLVALLMLMIHPGWIWDVGYQLSVVATAGLLWLEKPISHIKIIWPIAKISGLSESLAASFATLPVLVLNFGWDRVGLAGVFVNIIAGIFVGPIMAVGAGVVLVGSVWPFGGKILAILGRPVIQGLLTTIELGAWLNGKMR